MIRAALLLLAMLAANTASAVPSAIVPGEPCIRISQAAEDPFALLANPAAFDCQRTQVGATGRYTWGLVRGLNLVTDPRDPWELRHGFSQAKSETMFVRYADGSMVQAPSDRMSARRMFSPGEMSFALPDRPGRIVAILIRTEGLQNQRGIAAGAKLMTTSAALQSDLIVLILYGLLGGAVIGLFAYNLALYTALRYPFILCYCLSTIAILGFGVTWSGGIFLFAPTLDTTDQISWTMLGIAAVMATSALFTLTYIERRFLPCLASCFTLVAATIGVASAVIRLIDVEFAWNLMDRIGYGAILAVLAGMLLTAAIAARRGSPSARIYLIAWVLPILVAGARTLWGVGLIGVASTLICMSPLIIMAFEALLSAIAVSWRIGGVRRERDEARATQAQLRFFAETDALTNLLNRRAFIDRANDPLRQSMVQRLVLIDIDQFKLVNDRYGHQAGDDVLVRVAEVLRQVAPDNALVGRLGGEEFAVLVEAEPVDALADRLCKAVAASAPEGGISVTISAGVAEAYITNDGDWRKLHYAADQALYRAKHGGRNRVSRAPRPVAA